MEQENEFLSQDEVDALLNGIGGETSANVAQDAAQNVQPYDPASREHLSGIRLPVLESINEKFSRALRIVLTDFTRMPCELTLSPLRILKFGDLAHGLPAVTGAGLFSLAPLHGTGALFMDHDTASVIIDSLFGGGGRQPQDHAGREFSPIELRMVEKVHLLTLDCYRKTWSAVHPAEFAYLSSETHKQFANIAEADEPVAVTALNLKIGQSGGEILLCLPYRAIEPIRHLLSRATREEEASADRNWLRLLSARVQSAEIEICANLGTAVIPLRQIMAMQAGDFIPVSVPDKVAAQVDGFPLMECSFGISNGQYSLRVERILPQNQQEPAHGSID